MVDFDATLFEQKNRFQLRIAMLYMSAGTHTSWPKISYGFLNYGKNAFYWNENVIKTTEKYTFGILERIKTKT